MKMLARVVAFCLLACATISGDVPTLMTYRGRPTKGDGISVQDGNYRVRFSIWADAISGTEKWFQEMNPVVVHNGVCAVVLGG